jgi:hypothetical protein
VPFGQQLRHPALLGDDGIDAAGLGIQEISYSLLSLSRRKRNRQTQNDSGVEIPHSAADGFQLEIRTRQHALKYIPCEMRVQYA